MGLLPPLPPAPPAPWIVPLFVMLTVALDEIDPKVRAGEPVLLELITTPELTVTLIVAAPPP